MTVDEVANEIELAMRTLRHMPPDGPCRVKAAWPDVLMDAAEAYGWEPARINRLPPSPEDISRMDVVLFVWFPRLTDDERMLLSARGAGMSWRRIMCIRRKLHSRSHAGHRFAWRKTIAKMAAWPLVRAA